MTSVFRDPQAFERLAETVVTPLVAQTATGDAIRVSSAGCSTGEEAYSLAMLFPEAFDAAKKWPQFKVFATDVEQANIDAAAAGVYPASIEAEISPELVDKYFLRRGDQLHVRPDLPQAIVFARHNLLADPPFTKLDLATCRNTLIYFKTAAQDRAVRKLQYALRPRGYLFLGSSESLGAAQGDLGSVSQRHKIWRKERETRLPVRDLTAEASPLAGYGARAGHGPAKINRAPTSAVELGYRSLMDGFGPPAVLVNARQEIVHSHGQVQRYLQVREGSPRLGLARMLPKALVPVASVVLFKLARTGERAVSDPVRLADDDGNGQRVRLHAISAGEKDGETLGLLVFEDMPTKAAHSAIPPVNVMDEASERVEFLENELATTRENLQATIEELEASNEELQSVNEELNTDTAMYSAKAAGCDRIVLFDDKLGEQAAQALNLRNAVVPALANGEIELHYQPVFRLSDGHVCGAEALVRWNRPGFGLIPPGEFLSSMELGGLIAQLDHFVLQEAIATIAEWQRRCLCRPGWIMSVNQTAVDITAPNWAERLRRMMTRAGLVSTARGKGEHGVALQIELTEEHMAQPSETVLRNLHALVGMGVSLAVDDFRQGYSSMSYLQSLPISTLKIDQAFVRDLDIDPNSNVLVEAMVSLSKRLGYLTVAEGVEQQSRVQTLSALGCDIGQGFLVSGAVSKAEFEDRFLKR